MDFEWDDRKAARNVALHGVEFHDAVLVFRDLDRLESEDARLDYGELRFVSVGFAGASILAVVYVEREGSIRIISARKATQR